ncbi:MAG TPA: adenylate/guanylate cyclase domain-containing protein, partial [Chitinophagaceae bacterium]
TALNNIGGVYAMKPETYDKALYYYLKALHLSEEINYDAGIGTTSVNIGEVYSNTGKSALALQYFHKSLEAYQRSRDEVSIPYTYNAIGKEYRKMGQYDLALQYHRSAYSTAEKVERQQYMVQSLIGLASTYTAMGEFQSALNYYKRAEWIGKEINALDELKDVYLGLSASYARANDYNNAFRYQTLYSDVKDKLYNIETDKKLTRMEFDFNLQKKQSEINLLTKARALRELELKRQKQAKYAFMTGLALLGLIAFILYRNYRAKVKINQVLDHQKDQIESLLLNILPAEVAKELQETGTATPRHYENVSVLFSDFKGFTSLADKMSPGELVEELSACFTAFDHIIEKHKLEKIKTIGDAYMCAGGIPVPDKDHPFRIVQASMEIQDYILKNNLKRKARGLPPWDIRIGIHAGPVVAGVVGKKKYAYDIWGSTVNIASRMESNSAPGQINISSAMYDIIKDKYVCSHRGKILAKNVGEIDMYFLEHEIKIPVREFQPDVILQ